MTKKREVFLAYTRSDALPEKQLIAIYSKSSYQQAHDWIAEKAERYGNGLAPGLSQVVVAGTGKIACQTMNIKNGQVWWLERHEVR